MEEERAGKADLLNERMKELRCLYRLSEIIDRDITIEETCSDIVEIIPCAWQHSDVACARITLAGVKFETANFAETPWKQTSPICIHGRNEGSVEVCYLEERPQMDEGPFFREERDLLDAIAERVGKAAQHKRAEGELRQAKDYIENLLNNANAPIIVWDANCRVTIFNHAFERLTGLRSDAVVGRPLEMLFPPASLSNTMGLIRLAMAGERWAVDISIQCADGGVRTVLWNSATIHDPRGGGPVATIAQGHDITERKRMEDALRESESRFLLISENVNDAFSIYDVENKTHVYFNKVFGDITGIPEVPLDETLDKLLEIVHPDDRKRVADTYSCREAGTVEYRILHRDGRGRWLRRRSFPVRDESGLVRNIVGVTTDITDIKTAEAVAELHRNELIQADKMASLGRIVSGVAHEINNPNNFIMLNAPLLRKAWESALPVLEACGGDYGQAYIGKMRLEDFSEYVFPLIDGVLDGSRRIARIVADLKDFARPDVCDVSGYVDFAQVVRSAVNLMRNTLAKKAVELDVSVGDTPIKVQGSFQRLEQVVINLLQNSCDAISKEGDRSISLLLDGAPPDSVVLCIRDTGCGIAPQNIPRLTEPFFTTKRSSGGTGLGLSVSSKIVADHGGKLLFESEAGAGTTVKLVLPRRRA